MRPIRAESGRRERAIGPGGETLLLPREYSSGPDDESNKPHQLLERERVDLPVSGHRGRFLRRFL
jgi:hypothetical protein